MSRPAASWNHEKYPRLLKIPIFIHSGSSFCHLHYRTEWNHTFGLVIPSTIPRPRHKTASVYPRTCETKSKNDSNYKTIAKLSPQRLTVNVTLIITGTPVNKTIKNKKYFICTFPMRTVNLSRSSNKKTIMQLTRLPVLIILDVVAPDIINTEPPN